MAQIHIETTAGENGEFEVLDLELCPRAVQVMPPEAKRPFPFLLTVLGNVILGSLLIGATLMLPTLLAGLFTAF